MGIELDVHWGNELDFDPWPCGLPGSCLLRCKLKGVGHHLRKRPRKDGAQSVTRTCRASWEGPVDVGFALAGICKGERG